MGVLMLVATMIGGIWSINSHLDNTTDTNAYQNLQISICNSYLDNSKKTTCLENIQKAKMQIIEEQQEQQEQERKQAKIRDEDDTRGVLFIFYAVVGVTIFCLIVSAIQWIKENYEKIKLYVSKFGK